MKDDVRKYIYGALIAFLVVILTWLSIIYISACGITLTCQRGYIQSRPHPNSNLVPRDHARRATFYPEAHHAPNSHSR